MSRPSKSGKAEVLRILMEHKEQKKALRFQNLREIQIYFKERGIDYHYSYLSQLFAKL